MYDFAPDPHLNSLTYEENFNFFFISVRIHLFSFLIQKFDSWSLKF